MKNRYEIQGDIVFVFAQHLGKEVPILVSTAQLPKLLELGKTWHVRTCYKDTKYAATFIYHGKVGGKKKYETLYMHRFLCQKHKSELKTYVDHKNGNGLDNTDGNISIVSAQVNARNRQGATSHNKSSGIRNVYWNDGKWIVQLRVNGKATVFGRFSDIVEAEKVAIEMRIKHFGKA